MKEDRIFIPLVDGTRLATSLYLPDEQAPVILEALPYRKDDLTANYAGEYRRLRDEDCYAIARVDLRGTGSSDGIATDEYRLPPIRMATSLPRASESGPSVVPRFAHHGSISPAVPCPSRTSRARPRDTPYYRRLASLDGGRPP